MTEQVTGTPEPNKNNGTINPEEYQSGVEVTSDGVVREFDKTTLPEAIDRELIDKKAKSLTEMSDEELALLGLQRAPSSPAGETTTTEAPEKQDKKESRFTRTQKAVAAVATGAVLSGLVALGIAKPWQRDEVNAAPVPQTTTSAPVNPGPSSAPSAETAPSSSPSASVEASTNPEVVNEDQNLEAWFGAAYTPEMFEGLPATDRVKVMVYLKYLQANGLMNQSFDYKIETADKAYRLNEAGNSATPLDEGQRIVDHYENSYQMAVAVTQNDPSRESLYLADGSNFDTIQKIAASFNYSVGESSLNGRDGSTYEDDISALEDMFNVSNKQDRADTVEDRPEVKDYSDFEEIEGDKGEVVQVMDTISRHQSRTWLDRYALIPYDFKFTSPIDKTIVHLTGNEVMRFSRAKATSDSL